MTITDLVNRLDDAVNALERIADALEKIAHKEKTKEMQELGLF